MGGTMGTGATEQADGGRAAAGGAAGHGGGGGAGASDGGSPATDAASPLPSCSAAPLDAGPANCHDLATAGDWVVAKMNATAAGWPIPAGGRIPDAEYDLVVIESTKSAILPTRETVRVRNSGAQFDIVMETEAAAGEKDVVRWSGDIEWQGNRVVFDGRCGQFGGWALDYVVEPGGFRGIERRPDGAVLLVFRQRCGAPVATDPGDELRPRIADVAKALCAKIGTCCGAQGFGFITGSPISQMDCPSYVVMSLSSEIDELRQSLQANRSGLMASALDACLADLPQHACAAFGAELAPPPLTGVPFAPSYLTLLQCPSVIVPKVTERSVCENDFECLVGRCREMTTGQPHRCIVNGALGEACDDNGVACGPGLFCAVPSRTCHAQAPEGGVCEAPTHNTAYPCQPGLYCKQGPGGGLDLTCARRLALGAACMDGFSPDCIEGTFCCLPNTSDGLCSGLSTSFRCIPKFPDGHACSNDLACLSSHCVSNYPSPGGQCEEPPTSACH